MFLFFILVILLLSESICQDDNIGEIADILINLLSKTLTLSLDMAVKKTLINGDENQIESMFQCRKYYSIFDEKYDEYDQKNKKLRQYYSYLLYYESSKSRNDLGEYSDCLDSQSIDFNRNKSIQNFTDEEKKEFKENTTFAIFKIIEPKTNKSFSNFTFKNDEHLFGLCIKKGCSEQNIKDVFIAFNNELILFDKLNESNFTVYDLSSRFNTINYSRLIPVIMIILIILLHLIFYILNKFCCEKYQKGILNDLFNIFNYKNNFKKILDKDNKENSGIKIFNGIRGIIFMSLILNLSFFYIYHLPTKVFNETIIEKLLNNFAFPLFYHGEIFGKKLLYALSGFELVNIMIPYLDNYLKDNVDNLKINEDNKDNIESDAKINESETPKKGQEDKTKEEKNLENLNVKEIKDEDDEEDEEINEENEDNIGKIDKGENQNNYKKNQQKNYDNYLKELLSHPNSRNDSANLLEGIDDEKEKIINKDDNEIKSKETNESNMFDGLDEISLNYNQSKNTIKIKILFIWYFRQFYKFILFIFAMYLYKYGTIYPFLLMRRISPIWRIYFDDISLKFSQFHILANLFLFSPFSYKTYYWVDPFALVYNEITYFLIGSLLIYLCYKYAKRLDIIILISSLILFVLKIIFGIFCMKEINYYPAMFYQSDGSYVIIRNYLSSNQFMNLNIFLIGMFFGDIYYCIDIIETKRLEENENKEYFPLPINLAKIIRDKYILGCGYDSITYLLLTVLFVLYLGIVYIFQIFIYLFMKDKNNEKYYTFFEDKVFNLIALLGADFGVFIVLFIIIILILTKELTITKFLEHRYWRILSKPYWSNLLLLHICATFSIYYTENRIKLGFTSIFFFSFEIIIILALISSILFFTCIEMPIKNINRVLILKENKKKREEDLNKDSK